MLAAGYTDPADSEQSERIDDELVADLLNLACVKVGDEVSIDDTQFAVPLEAQRAEFKREVQGRNARYYNQQEEILDRNIKDRRAEFDAKVRDYRAKEKEARKTSRNTDDPLEQLRFKKDAAKWDRKADEAEDDYRLEKRRLRDEADDILDLIAQALSGTQRTEHLFSIRWRVNP